ncbi:hypothetical protein P344_06460 [Spiroplasma mirum ATCC 29335]|uniref:Uncharacterized protein n=1 Tax=Spiroplasma mirum ATCC 29335 TaxID=838561 RepID=W0GSB3_9MOLU|nr:MULTISPECIES: hypothetical protein [Spiroplasma]AHF61456.1 hypothetical protein SMM_1085 [Spiroplasma mirum ATCC 29335]AHI58595.1 hypothetical protein P344_06460 [Spiroplasma mirum ATCC 29335]AKM53499.1 hypothetical protein SATRI_v1c11520 [Spiroplasma atrichopogonis]
MNKTKLKLLTLKLIYYFLNIIMIGFLKLVNSLVNQINKLQAKIKTSGNLLDDGIVNNSFF